MAFPTGIADYGTRNINYDNMTGFSQSSNSLAQLGTTPEIGMPTNPFSFTGPNAIYQTPEDTPFHYTAYPMKIAPTSDGSTVRLGRGDLCYSCYTQEDMSQGNDVFTVFSMPRINSGSYQKAVRQCQDEYTPGVVTKRMRGIKNTVPGDRYIRLFPSTVADFKANWSFAGVMQQKTPDDITNLKYKMGYDPNLESVARMASMAIANEVTLPCLMTENVKISKTIYEIAAMYDKTVQGVYDEKGRPLNRMLSMPVFSLMYVCTEDNSYPSYQQYSREVIGTREFIIPNIDPMTGKTLPFQLPPMSINTTAVHCPLIRPLGVIREMDSPIPTTKEVDSALVDVMKYKELLNNSPMRVLLLSQGWGPFNAKR